MDFSGAASTYLYVKKDLLLFVLNVQDSGFI